MAAGGCSEPLLTKDEDLSSSFLTGSLNIDYDGAGLSSERQLSIS